MPAKIPESPVTLSDLDLVVARQIKRAERRSRKRVPDPELYAMFAVSQTVALDPGAKKQLGRRLALHMDLISDPAFLASQSPQTMQALDHFAGWAISDLKKYRRDLTDLPRVWQVALKATAGQYGNPDI